MRKRACEGLLAGVSATANANECTTPVPVTFPLNLACLCPLTFLTSTQAGNIVRLMALGFCQTWQGGYFVVCRCGGGSLPCCRWVEPCKPLIPAFRPPPPLMTCIGTGCECGMWLIWKWFLPLDLWAGSGWGLSCISSSEARSIGGGGGVVFVVVCLLCSTSWDVAGHVERRITPRTGRCAHTIVKKPWATQFNSTNRQDDTFNDHSRMLVIPHLTLRLRYFYLSTVCVVGIVH